MDTEPSSIKERRTRCKDFMMFPPHAKAAVMKMCEAPMRRWCCMNSRYNGKFCGRRGCRDEGQMKNVGVITDCKMI